MIRVYIEDWEIKKTVLKYKWISSDSIYENYIDCDIDISEHIVYEDWQVKIYWESNIILKRKLELETKESLTEQEQEEIEYINNLVQI